MNINSDVNLHPHADSDIDAEMNGSAELYHSGHQRSADHRQIGRGLLTQGSQPERTKRRSRNMAAGREVDSDECEAAAIRTRRWLRSWRQAFFSILNRRE
jgi:hypothetical protein